MAITFLEQRKRQQYMIPLLVLVIVITALVVWFGILKPQQPSQSVPTDYIPSPEEGLPSILRKVDVNFNFLQNFTPKDFQFSEPVSGVDQEIGRENPFIPF